MQSDDTPAYRKRRADECRAMAKAAPTEKERAQWLELANLWLGKPDQIKSEE